MKKKMGLLLAGVLIFTLIGCGKSEGGTDTSETAYKNDVTVQTLKTEVVTALGDNYWPNMEMDAATFESFMQVTADTYDEFVAEMPMISTNVDTMVIVKAKDGQVDKVTEILTAYQDRMKADTLQYPMNLPKIQASKVVAFGNYVCFVQLGADTSQVEDQEEAIIKYCEGENQKALDAIEAALKK